jgi:enoyl-CoA hydratase
VSTALLPSPPQKKPKFASSEACREAYEEKELLGPNYDLVLKALTLRFLKFPKPSICAVNGLAVGGAVNFCWFYHDIVLASTQAKFRYPFSDLGITPELGSSLLLPRTVGLTNAKRIFFMGEWVSAEEALRLGLVNEVLAADELMPRAMAICKKLLKKSVHALGLTKQLVIGQLGLENLASALDTEQEFFNKAFMSPDFAKAMAKFRAKHSGKKAEHKSKTARSKL